MTKKKTLITTPRGVASWPRLNTPDTKFDARGKYSAKLRLRADDPEVQAFVAKLTALRDDFLAETVADLKANKKAALALELKPGEIIKVERDQETGDETGYLIFMGSMYASGERKDGSAWTQKPSIFSAKGVKLANPPVISGGSELKLSVEVEPFINQTSKLAVLSVRLKAVQVIKLSSGGERSFSDLGFAAEEGDDIEDGTAFSDESQGGSDTGSDENSDL
jgi:hypothetical protein